MRKTLIAAAAAAWMCSILSTPALAAPKDDMCKLVSVLATEGVPAAVSLIEELADYWPPEQRAKIDVVVGSELEKFSYRGGQVYQIADLPGAVQEFFITMNLISNGSVYLRVLFEGNGTGEFVFLNIELKASYEAAIATQFLQKPVPVPCS